MSRSRAAETMISIQNLCASKTAHVRPNHRLRRRAKSPEVNDRAQAGALVNVNTALARAGIMARDLRCSGIF